ncbi:hypothetical protein ANTQUA_LOCUS4971 [Anthophora quadrimaculata]
MVLSGGVEKKALACTHSPTDSHKIALRNRLKLSRKSPESDVCSGAKRARNVFLNRRQKVKRVEGRGLEGGARLEIETASIILKLLQRNRDVSVEGASSAKVNVVSPRLLGKQNQITVILFTGMVNSKKEVKRSIGKFILLKYGPTIFLYSVKR